MSVFFETYRNEIRIIKAVIMWIKKQLWLQINNVFCK